MSPRRFAILMLLLATVVWGYSFPVGKALLLALNRELPGQTEWFFSSLMISFRFFVAAGILIALQPKAFLRMRPSEWRQGIGLGFFAGFGMLLQADGLHYTEASTVAFLTQFTAVLVPVYCAIRNRRAPSSRIIVCVTLVMIGVAILGKFDWWTLRFGRGEAETLLATAFFTGQILWLDRSIFRGNDTGRVSIVMFLACALLLTPVWVSQSRAVSDFTVIAASAPILLTFLSLTLLCSLLAFLLMNRWQPHVDPSTAGIVYCAEPVFTTAMALVLPVPFANWLGVEYANERFTTALLIGGGLITLANILMAWEPAKQASD